MTHFEIPQEWIHDIHSDRECGPCYACCIWLGIAELKKYTGQTCKHLNGGTDPCKRCSIYSNRPQACSEYKCMWRVGWGPQELRPHESGILITPYESERDPPGSIAFTVNIIDDKKAAPYIDKVLAELLPIPRCTEVRLIYIHRKKAMMFRDGHVYLARLLPPDGYESLVFEAHEPSVGQYRIEEMKRRDQRRSTSESGPALPPEPSTVDT